VPENPAPLPDFTRWPSFPFEGDMRIKKLAAPVEVEPPRSGEDAGECVACNTPDEAYMWVSERWRVRAMDRPTGLPMVLILECRSHLDLGDLPNLLAAELGVMTVRLERAIRSLDGVARVHVNRWGDGSAHLHMWFLARPYGRLQLRGTFLSLWDDILPVIPERQWRENLALVAAWLADFGGSANAEPAHIQWQSPNTISDSPLAVEHDPAAGAASSTASRPADLADMEGSKPDSQPDGATMINAETRDLTGSAARAEAMHSQQARSEAQRVDETTDGPEGDSTRSRGSSTEALQSEARGEGAARGGIAKETPASVAEEAKSTSAELGAEDGLDAAASAGDGLGASNTTGGDARVGDAYAGTEGAADGVSGDAAGDIVGGRAAGDSAGDGADADNAGGGAPGGDVGNDADPGTTDGRALAGSTAARAQADNTGSGGRA
jgi:hypothetical protein